MAPKRGSLKTVQVHFEIAYSNRKLTDPFRLAISGSIESLGKWDMTACLIAMESEDTKGTWMVDLEMQKHNMFQWRWVVLSKEDNSVLLYESGTRKATVGHYGCSYIVPKWGESEEVFVDFPIKESSSVDIIGTTDVDATKQPESGKPQDTGDDSRKTEQERLTLDLLSGPIHQKSSLTPKITKHINRLDTTHDKQSHSQYDLPRMDRPAVSSKLTKRWGKEKNQEKLIHSTSAPQSENNRQDIEPDVRVKIDKPDTLTDNGSADTKEHTTTEELIKSFDVSDSEALDTQRLIESLSDTETPCQKEFDTSADIVREYNSENQSPPNLREQYKLERNKEGKRRSKTFKQNISEIEHKIYSSKESNMDRDSFIVVTSKARYGKDSLHSEAKDTIPSATSNENNIDVDSLIAITSKCSYGEDSMNYEAAATTPVLNENQIDLTLKCDQKDFTAEAEYSDEEESTKPKDEYDSLGRGGMASRLVDDINVKTCITNDPAIDITQGHDVTVEGRDKNTVRELSKAFEPCENPKLFTGHVFVANDSNGFPQEEEKINTEMDDPVAISSFEAIRSDMNQILGDKDISQIRRRSIEIIDSVPSDTAEDKIARAEETLNRISKTINDAKVNKLARQTMSILAESEKLAELDLTPSKLTCSTRFNDDGSNDTPKTRGLVSERTLAKYRPESPKTDDSADSASQHSILSNKIRTRPTICRGSSDGSISSIIMKNKKNASRNCSQESLLSDKLRKKSNVSLAESLKYEEIIIEERMTIGGGTPRVTISYSEREKQNARSTIKNAIENDDMNQSKRLEHDLHTTTKDIKSYDHAIEDNDDTNRTINNELEETNMRGKTHAKIVDTRIYNIDDYTKIMTNNSEANNCEEIGESLDEKPEISDFVAAVSANADTQREETDRIITYDDTTNQDDVAKATAMDEQEVAAKPKFIDESSVEKVDKLVKSFTQHEEDRNKKVYKPIQIDKVLVAKETEKTRNRENDEEESLEYLKRKETLKHYKESRLHNNIYRQADVLTTPESDVQFELNHTVTRVSGSLCIPNNHSASEHSILSNTIGKSAGIFHGSSEESIASSTAEKKTGRTYSHESIISEKLRKKSNVSLAESLKYEEIIIEEKLIIGAEVPSISISYSEKEKANARNTIKNAIENEKKIMSTEQNNTNKIGDNIAADEDSNYLNVPHEMNDVSITHTRHDEVDEDSVVNHDDYAVISIKQKYETLDKESRSNNDHTLAPKRAQPVEQLKCADKDTQLLKTSKGNELNNEAGDVGHLSEISFDKKKILTKTKVDEEYDFRREHELVQKPKCIDKTPVMKVNKLVKSFTQHEENRNRKVYKPNQDEEILVPKDTKKTSSPEYSNEQEMTPYDKTSEMSKLHKQSTEQTRVLTPSDTEEQAIDSHEHRHIAMSDHSAVREKRDLSRKELAILKQRYLKDEMNQLEMRMNEKESTYLLGSDRHGKSESIKQTKEHSDKEEKLHYDMKWCIPHVKHDEYDRYENKGVRLSTTTRRIPTSNNESETSEGEKRDRKITTERKTTKENKEKVRFQFDDEDPYEIARYRDACLENAKAKPHARSSSIGKIREKFTNSISNDSMSKDDKCTILETSKQHTKLREKDSSKCIDIDESYILPRPCMLSKENNPKTSRPTTMRTRPFREFVHEASSRKVEIHSPKEGTNETSPVRETYPQNGRSYESYKPPENEQAISNSQKHKSTEEKPRSRSNSNTVNHTLGKKNLLKTENAVEPKIIMAERSIPPEKTVVENTQFRDFKKAEQYLETTKGVRKRETSEAVSKPVKYLKIDTASDLSFKPAPPSPMKKDFIAELKQSNRFIESRYNNPHRKNDIEKTLHDQKLKIEEVETSKSKEVASDYPVFPRTTFADRIQSKFSPLISDKEGKKSNFKYMSTCEPRAEIEHEPEPEIETDRKDSEESATLGKELPNLAEEQCSKTKANVDDKLKEAFKTKSIKVRPAEGESVQEALYRAYKESQMKSEHKAEKREVNNIKSVSFCTEQKDIETDDNGHVQSSKAVSVHSKGGHHDEHKHRKRSSKHDIVQDNSNKSDASDVSTKSHKHSKEHHENKSKEKSHKKKSKIVKSIENDPEYKEHRQQFDKVMEMFKTMKDENSDVYKKHDEDDKLEGNETSEFRQNIVNEAGEYTVESPKHEICELPATTKTKKSKHKSGSRKKVEYDTLVTDEWQDYEGNDEEIDDDFVEFPQRKRKDSLTLAYFKKRGFTEVENPHEATEYDDENVDYDQAVEAEYSWDDQYADVYAYEEATPRKQKEIRSVKFTENLEETGVIGDNPDRVYEEELVDTCEESHVFSDDATIDDEPALYSYDTTFTYEPIFSYEPVDYPQPVIKEPEPVAEKAKPKPKEAPIVYRKYEPASELNGLFSRRGLFSFFGNLTSPYRNF